MTDLEQVLLRLGLSQYLERFLAEGFEDWETVQDINEDDLVALDVKRGHRRREIASTRGVSLDQGLQPSTRSTPTDDRPTDVDEKGITPKDEYGRSGTGQGGKRKYRRHPKADENAPERPPSAYVIFSNKTREDLRGQNLSFTEIAKLVGEKWQVLSPAQKEPYDSQASAAKERYNGELAVYKKTDGHRAYTQYLADFKAKYSVQPSERKRSKGDSTPSGGGSAHTPSGILSPRSIVGSRGNNESPSSTGTYARSSGQLSPSTVSSTSPSYTPHTNITPVMASSSVGGGGGSGGGGVGVSGRRGSPKSASPVVYSGRRDSMMLDAGRSSVPTHSLPLREDAHRDSHAAAHGHQRMEPLPRIAQIEDQGWRSGQTTLPPLNIDENEVPCLSGRRSQQTKRPPTHLQREGTTWSSTSSGSTMASGSTNSSYLPRTPTDGAPFQRGLPQLPPPTADGSQPYATMPRMNPPPQPTDPHPRPHYAPSGSADLASRGLSSPGSHALRDPNPYPGHMRLSQPPHKVDGPPSHALHPVKVRRNSREMDVDESSGSQSSQMSDVHAASPFSVLLRAGEMAARDADKPP